MCSTSNPHLNECRCGVPASHIMTMNTDVKYRRVTSSESLGCINQSFKTLIRQLCNKISYGNVFKILAKTKKVFSLERFLIQVSIKIQLKLYMCQLLFTENLICIYICIIYICMYHKYMYVYIYMIYVS